MSQYRICNENFKVRLCASFYYSFTTYIVSTFFVTVIKFKPQWASFPFATSLKA